jgi:Protein of unknown function (DUF3987)
MKKTVSEIDCSPFGTEPNSLPDKTVAELEAEVNRAIARESIGGDCNSRQQGARPWPEAMDDAALYGLAGEFVRLVLPQTEADQHALLLIFLAGFGCMVGRGAFFQVESTRHYANLFTVIVGDTAKARKGTATDRALQLLESVDADFMKTQKRSGLSSGEGLIYLVRDARQDDVAVKVNGSTARFERQTVDTGEEDKRLLVVESEFAQALQASGREGNILSAVLRDAWDGKPLGVMAKSNKDRCQEPHIALVGNVTVEELRRLLTSNDKANGFGNRILWCSARRSKLLPHGGSTPDPAAWDSLTARLRNALETARCIGRVTFDEKAKRAWEQLYPKLTEGASGLFGSMTARAEAQCVRLAMLFALLDSSPLIRHEHLSAATEVWGYCEASVRFIFGDSLGDETADAILRKLATAAEGMTQTELSNGFGRHKAAAELQRALGALQERRLVVSTRKQTGGGPATVYSIAKRAN